MRDSTCLIRAHLLNVHRGARLQLGRLRAALRALRAAAATGRLAQLRRRRHGPDRCRVGATRAPRAPRRRCARRAGRTALSNAHSGTGTAARDCALSARHTRCDRTVPAAARLQLHRTGMGTHLGCRPPRIVIVRVD
eukprot:1287402-Prymnesium_polylepis.1